MTYLYWDEDLNTLYLKLPNSKRCWMLFLDGKAYPNWTRSRMNFENKLIGERELLDKWD